MTPQTALAAIKRARKSYARATAALANAESESARKRHARRAHNAARAAKTAERDYNHLAMQEA